MYHRRRWRVHRTRRGEWGDAIRRADGGEGNCTIRSISFDGDGEGGVPDAHAAATTTAATRFISSAERGSATPDGFRVHARWSHARAGAASGAPTSISSLKSALRPSSSPPPRRMASKGASCGIVGNCLAADHPRERHLPSGVISRGVSRALDGKRDGARDDADGEEGDDDGGEGVDEERGVGGESGGRGWASRWRRLERSERS